MSTKFDSIFDVNKQNELLAIVLKISNKSKSLVDYFTEIRFVSNMLLGYLLKLMVNFSDSALSRDAEVRRNALNEYAFILINLPSDFLHESEIAHILEFFTSRFADSGHTADLLVTTVHHLIFLRELDSNVVIDTLFHKIFDDAGVQAYIQSDREKLLEIFEFFVKKHFNG
jgi:hypothetical protein